MRYLLTALLLCAVALFGAWTHGLPGSITVNITDAQFAGGAACNGSSSDAAAFDAFHTWALSQTKPIILNLPTNGVCEPNVSAPANFPFSGISVGLTVVGNNSTLQNGPMNTGFLRPGADSGPCKAGDSTCGSACGALASNYCIVFTQAASAGDSCVTALTPSDVNLLPAVGNYAIMNAVNQQQTGEPISPYYFDYVKIVSANASTGQVCFTPNLAYSYKTTWANNFHLNGGAAALLGYTPNWANTNVTFNGVKFDAPNQDSYTAGFNAKFINSSSTGCVLPTNVKTFTLQTFTFIGGACSLEVDKVIDTVVFDGVTHTGGAGVIFTQSSSPLHFNISNSTITSSGGLNGTGKNATITNSTFSLLNLGPTFYGEGGTVICNTCVITTVGANTATVHPVTGVENLFTMNMSNGTIEVPQATWNGQDILGWGIPGATVIWGGLYNTVGAFTITDQSQDVSQNFFVTTSLAANWPTLPTDSSGLSFNMRGPAFTCTSCTGSLQAVGLSNANGAGKHPYEYENYTICTNGSICVTPDVSNTVALVNFPGQMWGKFTSLTIDVQTHYSGVQNPLFMQLNSNNLHTVNTSGAAFTYQPQIDLRTAGKRVITASGVTCNGSPGGCGADSGLTLPSQLWMTGVVGFNFTQNIVSEGTGVYPTVNVEWIGDQSNFP